MNERVLKNGKLYFPIVLSIIVVMIYSMNVLEKLGITNKQQETIIASKTASIDNIDVPIWEKDTNDIFLGCNKAYENQILKPLLGDTVEREDYYGLPCDSIFGVDINGLFAENDKTVYRFKKTLQFKEYSVDYTYDTIEVIVPVDTAYDKEGFELIINELRNEPIVIKDTTFYHVSKYIIYDSDSAVIGIGGMAKLDE